MTWIQWSESLSVGIPSIDVQHQGLVTLLNELHRAMLERSGPDVLDPVFARLLTYTEEHFVYEEGLLAGHGYLELVEHCEQHRALRARVQELSREYELRGAQVLVEVMEFLRDWLRDHIAGTDQRYASYLIERGVR